MKTSKPVAYRETERIEFSWDEVVPILLKARGIESGLWSFGVRFNFGATNAGQDEENISPSGIMSVRGLSLRVANERGPLVYDASTGARVPLESKPIAKKLAQRKVTAGKSKSATPKHK